jgi:hypothetical protein
MSIKPIDYQVVVPKTSEVSQVQSGEHQKSAVFQQQQVSSMQSKIDSSLKQVYSQEKLYDVKIRDKQERNGRDERKKNKERNNKKNKNGYGVQSETENIIDIKI